MLGIQSQSAVGVCSVGDMLGEHVANHLINQSDVKTSNTVIYQNFVLLFLINQAAAVSAIVLQMEIPYGDLKRFNVRV